MPFLRFVAPELSGYSELMSNLGRLWAFLRDEIAEHEASLPSEDQPRDLIDAFLMEIRTRAKLGEGDEGSIFDRELLLYFSEYCVLSSLDGHSVT